MVCCLLFLSNLLAVLLFVWPIIKLLISSSPTVRLCNATPLQIRHSFHCTQTISVVTTRTTENGTLPHNWILTTPSGNSKSGLGMPKVNTRQTFTPWKVACNCPRLMERRDEQHDAIRSSSSDFVVSALLGWNRTSSLCARMSVLHL